MKKIIIYIVLLFATNSVYSASEKITESCKLSAHVNQHYGKLIDIKFQIFIEQKKNLSLDQTKNLLKIIQNEHEDYKDKKYKEIRDYYEKRVRNREVDYQDAEIDRMILEAGVDSAYVIAAENYMDNNLNKPVEHYYRKILDGCIMKK